ncbi:gallate 1-beta-glucosyltransferase 84A24-like [Tasmannia lanceolata]|uniref:gallate 1-beta-glucosyltransferase 84A24-like n=1 Tax=Tasmannia lanceolata TaxID=3420 RepID=UPI0040643A39
MGDQIFHVLLFSFPGQGHVNPLLRLAKYLASKGLLVTFSTTLDLSERMQKATGKATVGDPTPIGKGYLRFEFFSDGWDLNDPKRLDFDAYMKQLKIAGPAAVAGVISRQAEEGRPVSYVINNPFLPWVLDISNDMGINCAMLWVQSCAVFAAYWHYFNQTVRYPSSEEPDITVRLPGMPELGPDDVPSFLLPTNPYPTLTDLITEQFGNMSKASWVLVDSFDALESTVLESISSFSPAKLTPVGPLFKSIESIDGIGSDVRGDLWKADDCLEWLDTQPDSSVVYISFGSVVVWGKDQMEEIALGIRNSGRSFLWVVKPAINSTETGLPEGFVEETAERGKVVGWCPQEKVLSHPSVACFFTHCGWNSSMESLSSGIPVIGFPQFGDQVTNAKFLSEVHGVGVRLRKDSGPLVSKEEVVRCINEVTCGTNAVEMKKNALKWKDAAREAVGEGGSSDRNIEAFVDDIKRRASNLAGKHGGEGSHMKASCNEIILDEVKEPTLKAVE